MLQIATVLATTLYTSLSSPAPTLAATQMYNTTSLASATGNNDGGQDEDTGECKLLGPFALLVQAALGLLALLSLVYKRWRERPQRPVKIWAFDASKQVFGTALLHLANLFMSMLSAGQIEAAIARAAANSIGAAEDRPRPNPCSFYLLNLAIDTTIGIPILIVLLRLIHAGASLTPIANPPESIKSGNYGQPPKATWWLKQSILYFLGLLGMKACVFLIFTLCPWIIMVGNWALRWTEGNEAIQIAFVMLIFPLIMNALQYYIIDSFIKNNKPALEDDNSDRERSEGEEDGLLAPEDGDIIESIDATVVQKEVLVTSKLEGSKTKSYGADKNNEPGTPAGESSSSSNSASHLEVDPTTRKAA
jgi:STIMATE family